MDSTFEEPLEVPEDWAGRPEAWSMRLSVLGAVLSVPGIIALLIGSGTRLWHLVSFSIYGIGLLSMFIASAMYHGAIGTRWELMLRKGDYCAIGIMIAGCYTPFCLIGLHTPLGLTVLGVAWALAGAASLLMAFKPDASKWTFVWLYLAMGWLALLLFFPMIKVIGWDGVGITLFGGALYTVGTLVFNRDDSSYAPIGFYAHDAWHIFILAAAATHYYVMYAYLLPLE